MATAKTTELRVALNPRNPEAMAWYSPDLNINLSLAPRRDGDGNPIADTGPISRDLSGTTEENLAPVVRGLRAGLLIVAKGELPAGLAPEEIDFYAAPRSRWDPDLESSMKSALAHFDKITKPGAQAKAQA